ncbi:MAG: superoxide dismutase [Robiginitomaculum sp.]
MAITLPDLPYAQDALEPHISARTISFHYGKHHAAYVSNLNKLIDGTHLDDNTLEEIILTAHGVPSKVGVYNNAAQVWNHSFYWNSMKKGGGGKPNGKIGQAIDRDFGSYDEFSKVFMGMGGTQFGSGWAWLVSNGGTLEVLKTPNAENPLTDGVKPLITMDVWEHAYYLDFQNSRPGYMNAFLEHLVNWDFAEENM